MSPLLAIRKHVFGVSQSEMAEIALTTQATVSRWETGELQPDLAQLDRIRTEAGRRALEWNDVWLFEAAPAPAEKSLTIAAK